MKVLAVDDDAVSRTILASALRRLGHDAVAVPDAAQALRLVAEQRISLVVTDWLMPGTDGLDLTRRLRADSTSPYTYVLILTAVEGRDNWLKAMDAGVDDFLPKPVDESMLGARIHVAERILGLMARNRMLARFIPICMYCKKARTDRDYWLDLDRFLDETSDVTLSHGICPDCNTKHVAPMLDELERRPPMI
jgi:sigma-B regulation protein RsbU (phosphoserine phosphatase)